ncbi:MAG: hypothetical protein KBT85_03465 [Pseudomonas sp.]|nr:hypothetical protein [Pseudomonas sp.]
MTECASIDHPCFLTLGEFWTAGINRWFSSISSWLRGRLQQEPDFLGSQRCAECHVSQHNAWRASQHAHAMAHADATTVLVNFDAQTFVYSGITMYFNQRNGRFFVTTDAPDGEKAEFEVLYTFGLEPLQ